MTLPSVTTVLAGQLGPTHLGSTVLFFDGPHRRTGRLEAIYTPRRGVRTLTLRSHRHHDIPASCEVDVISEGVSA